LTPMVKATTITVTKALETFCNTYGYPNVVLTDNGKQFTSNAYEQFLQNNDIRHRLVSLYSPQGNVVERYNQTMEHMLAKICHPHHRKWKQNLNHVQFVMNNTHNRVLNTTPAYLTFGRHPKGAGEISTPTTYEEDRDIQSFIEDLNTKAEHAYKYVRENQLRVHMRNKRRYDKSHKEQTFNQGDHVWVRTKILSKADDGIITKFAPKFDGPYTVKEKTSDLTYHLVDTRDPTHQVKRHTRDLKPYRAPGRTVLDNQKERRNNIPTENDERPVRTRRRPARFRDTEQTLQQPSNE